MLTLALPRMIKFEFTSLSTRRLYCSGTTHYHAGYNPNNSPKKLLQTELKSDLKAMSVWDSQLKVFESKLQPFDGHSLKDMGKSNFRILNLRVSDNCLDFCFIQHSQENPDIKAIYLTSEQKNFLGINVNEFPILLIGGKHDNPTVEIREKAVCTFLAPPIKAIFQLELQLLSKVIAEFAKLKQQPDLTSVNFYKVYPEKWMSWREGGGKQSKPILEKPWTISMFAEMNKKSIENLTNKSFEVLKVEKKAEPVMTSIYHYNLFLKIDSKIE